jgi:lipopolysaccharide export system permease protein
MQFLWKYIEDLVGKGLDWTIIAELLLYSSAGLVPMALPLAILLSSIMIFGNMGEHYELVALKSAGISLQRIMFPLVIVSIIISAGAFFFSNNVLPYTNLKAGSLLYDINHQRPELNMKDGIFNNDIDGYSIKIGHTDKKTRILHDIKIYDHRNRNGNSNVIIADSGKMVMASDTLATDTSVVKNEYMILELYNGCYYEDVKENKQNKLKTFPFRKDKFKKETIIFELVGFGLSRTDEDLFKDHYHMSNLAQLDYLLASNYFKNRNKELYSDTLKIGFSKAVNLITKITKKYTDTLIVENSAKNSIEKYYKKEFNSIKGSIKNEEQLVKKYSNTNHIEFNTDSLFNSLKNDKQFRIIKMAKNFARSTQKHISNTQVDFNARNKYINRHLIEWHKKFSLSFACIVLFFIGAPLGAIIRKGGFGMPVVISVLFFILYYILSISGEKFVKEGILEAYQGMWLSSIILLPLGIFLTYKATTDSAILNADAYYKFFSKIKSYIKNKKQGIS